MEPDDCEGCFKGVNLRSGIKYLDLRDYQFSFIEIIWLCEAIRGAQSNGFKKYVDRYNIRNKPVKQQFRVGTLTDDEFGITVTELLIFRSRVDALLD